jgi:hypothetical protein
VTRYANPYDAKRDHYLACARTAHKQLGDVPEKHWPIIRKLVANYVQQARHMNHCSMARNRAEDEREFRRRQARA